MSNGAPSLTPDALERAERTHQAREVVKVWTNAMKERGLESSLFSNLMPLNDQNAYLVGAIDTELREAGYVVASHSAALAGQQNGTPIMLHFFLVRAKAEPPRVLLA